MAKKITVAEWEMIIRLPWSNRQKAILQEMKAKKTTSLSRDFLANKPSGWNHPMSPMGSCAGGMNRIFQICRMPFRFKGKKGTTYFSDAPRELVKI